MTSVGLHPLSRYYEQVFVKRISVDLPIMTAKYVNNQTISGKLGLSSLAIGRQVVAVRGELDRSRSAGVE